MTADVREPQAGAPPAREVTIGEIVLALAGPLVWAVHFMVAYLAAEGACRLNMLGGAWLGVTGLGWLILAVTVPAAGMIIWAGLRAYARWRAVRDRHDPDLALGPRGLLALAGWTLSLVFGALVVLSPFPLVLVRPCAWL